MLLGESWVCSIENGPRLFRMYFIVIGHISFDVLLSATRIQDFGSSFLFHRLPVQRYQYYRLPVAGLESLEPRCMGHSVSKVRCPFAFKLIINPCQHARRSQSSKLNSYVVTYIRHLRRVYPRTGHATLIVVELKGPGYQGFPPDRKCCCDLVLKIPLD